MMETELQIGVEIKKVLDKKGMTVAEFARRIGTSPQNANSIFSRHSIDTELLKNISTAIEFDFFQFYKVEINKNEQKELPGSKIFGIDENNVSDLTLEFISDFIFALQKYNSKIAK